MQPLDAKAKDDPVALAVHIKSLAKGLGFDLVAIAPAGPSERAAFYRNWIAEGKAGEMSFLAERLEERLDPSVFLPGAKTAVCVAMNYYVKATPKESSPAQPSGRIARYALGDDYHELIKQKLFAIADFLREAVPGSDTRCGVDTAPIAEREMAARAGIGWVGKNTCIINERIGSWLFLGSVLSTIDLPIDSPTVDRCGTCTRCIDACPTQALSTYSLDARKCISYLTIEHQSEIETSLQANIGDWLFGCDICQEVCPWNNRAPSTEMPEFQPRMPGGRVTLETVLNWQKVDFDQTFRRSAVKRIRLPQLQRNAHIILAARENAAPRED